LCFPLGGASKCDGDTSGGSSGGGGGGGGGGTTGGGAVPGGVWVSPADGATFTSRSIHFAAHAYRTNSGDPAIDRVNFTATWPGQSSPTGAWYVVCTETVPVSGDVYQCDAQLPNSVPNGDVQISFDVYDKAGDVNLAPNGTHIIHLVLSGSGSGGGGTGGTGGTGGGSGGATCTSAGPVLTAPDNGAALPTTQDVTLSWSTSCPQSYVELSGAPYSTLNFGGWRTSTSVHIGQMWPGVFSWHVTTADANGVVSSWSETRTFGIGQTPPTTNSCTNGGDRITVWTQAHYQGSCTTYTPGQYNDLGSFNQNIRSIQDPGGAFHITLWSGTNATGTPAYFDQDVPDLTTAWSLLPSSLKVEQHRPTTCNAASDAVIVYIQQNWSGGCLNVFSSIPDLAPYNFDQIINSLQFAGSYVGHKQVTLYSGTNYQNPCGTYFQSWSDLRPVTALRARSTSVTLRPIRARRCRRALYTPETSHSRPSCIPPLQAPRSTVPSPPNGTAPSST
jgi:hypothetical protein